MNLREKKALVIGSGLGGIASALRLVAKGYNVQVIERQLENGGKATTFTSNGFTYDAGPTVITARFLCDELFSLFGKKIEDYVTLLDVNPWYQYDFPSGNRFSYGPSFESTVGEISRLYPEQVESYKAFYNYSSELFKIGYEKYGTASFDKASLLLSSLPELIRTGAFRNISGTIRRFFKEKELRQAFSIPPLLVGGNPDNTPAIYLLIHYLENRWGVQYAKGGTGALVAGLVKLAKDEGVQFVNGVTVDALEINSKKVRGVYTKEYGKVACDLLVYNGDPLFFYHYLMENQKLKISSYLKKKFSEPSMGLFVCYFSTKRIYETVPHHLMVINENFDHHLQRIFRDKKLPEQLNIYLHRPGATDKSMTKEGFDSFYALVPVPNLKAKIDWEEATSLLTKRVVDTLESRVLPGLKENIVDFHVKTPIDFSQQQNCYSGAAFTIQPKLTQSAYFRFPNRIPEIENGFFVGAGTHPGGGIPGVLTSAKIMESFL